MRHLDALSSEIEEWTARNFPGGTIDGIVSHLSKEHAELVESVASYLGPWSDLDGPFSPARAAEMGDVRRNDLLDEIADNVILLMRLTSALEADFLETVNNKWDVVRERDYLAYPRGRPTVDHRTIIERSSNDHRWVVATTIQSSGERVYLAREQGSTFYHLTKKSGSAYLFESEAEAEELIGNLFFVDDGGVPKKGAPTLQVFPACPWVYPAEPPEPACDGARMLEEKPNERD